MRKLYTGKLYGLAPAKKKLTEKQVLEVLNEAEAEFPTMRKATQVANEKFHTSNRPFDALILLNVFESLVMEWKKKWLSFETQNVV